MSRTYSIELKCGCLIATIETDGWEGLEPCVIEYCTPGEIAVNKKLKEQKRLHDECWNKYIEETK